MKTLTREGCFKLLKKYNVPENIVKHCIATNKVAMFIAKSLIKKGEKIDLSIVGCASLLHDIAKHKCLNNNKSHRIEGYKILLKEGYKRIALVVKVHVLNERSDKDALKTWEEKIVFYADKRVDYDDMVGVKERFEEGRKRYPNNVERINNEEKIAYQLEKEIFSKIGINPEEILRLK